MKLVLAKLESKADDTIAIADEDVRTEIFQYNHSRVYAVRAHMSILTFYKYCRHLKLVWRNYFFIGYQSMYQVKHWLGLFMVTLPLNLRLALFSSILICNPWICFTSIFCDNLHDICIVNNSEVTCKMTMKI